MADLEVTWFTDQAERSFFGRVDRKGRLTAGVARREAVAPVARVGVGPQSPATTRKRRPLETLIEELGTTLALVEGLWRHASGDGEDGAGGH